ncbi:MAG TPA: DUF3999 domain-containing protein [Steroidobacteraceae bacterium]|nr:DUF3999 domain-containing protein [Steroidobacteraceae bacterium]
MRTIAVIAGCVTANFALAASTLDDFARGVRIEAESGQPLIVVNLPDEVYQVATSPSLADVAVFNADGSAIPHAICAAAHSQPEQIAEQTLPIFESKPSTTNQASTSVEVQTNAGTRVNVDEQNASATSDTRFLIDARQADAPIRAITFEWSSSDHASEVKVSIESSSDLDAWRVVVPSTTLLRASGSQQQLRRDRVRLPQARYDYLRVRRVDGGPSLQLDSVSAETVTVQSDIEPLWIVAQPVHTTDPADLEFDSGRVAPISFVRLRVPLDNYSVETDIATRSSAKSAWIPRWSGESYVVTTTSDRRESDPVRLAGVTDRYWRVHIARGSATNLSLELGYWPNRLEFVAQGAAPYTVAFGSRRAEHTELVPCGSLLANMSAQERAKLTAEGAPGASVVLGGDDALQPLPRKTPTRLIVLWGSLITGVGILIAMALSLIKRLRNPPPSA